MTLTILLLIGLGSVLAWTLLQDSDSKSTDINAADEAEELV